MFTVCDRPLYIPSALIRCPTVGPQERHRFYRVRNRTVGLNSLEKCHLCGANPINQRSATARWQIWIFALLLLEINQLIEGEYSEEGTTGLIQSALVPREGAEQRDTFNKAEFR